MKIYRVGGCVRDALLGRAVVDRAWVVVGATPQQMVAAGYKPVGRDFPVFLHPVKREEYALARTERKTAPGYHGFAFHAAPDVTLEDDLARRDLTINAIAQADDGSLIDPHGGAADLRAKVLRHVGPAFAEDPVRILRLARFAARFADFRVADETLALMRGMVAAGEVDALVPERVWQELARGLMEDRPSRMFETLRACGALARLLPELDRLWGVPQPPQHHPEIDTGVHVMLVIDCAARLKFDLPVRWAALLHDLGKGTTDPALWPSHRGHEVHSVELAAAVSERLRAPADCRDLALLVAREHGLIYKIDELRAGTLVEI
ncbi:MAG: multifunctional CCA addition/repair protein, partial [Betaproteobacteria bacterium]